LTKHPFTISRVNKKGKGLRGAQHHRTLPAYGTKADSYNGGTGPLWRKEAPTTISRQICSPGRREPCLGRGDLIPFREEKGKKEEG